VRPVPFDRAAAREAAAAILDLKGADGVEVVFTGSTIGLTRYANSQIISNTVQETIRAHVRTAVDRRVAAASTNQLDPSSLALAAERALEAARSSPEDADFPGLPAPGEVGRADPVMRFDEATAESSPTDRAAAIAKILGITGGHRAAGIFETSSHAFGVISSTGIDCYDCFSRCIASCLTDTGESTGYKEASSHSRTDVDVEAVAEGAVDKAKVSRNAVDAPPGRYGVVLEPHAVAILLEYLSYTGFGAKQVLDGESFLSTRTDDMVASRAVTIADDVSHELSVGIGFDFEGVPRKRVAVIDAGRATGPVTDLRTAKKMRVAVSGHNSGSNEFGPYASNVVMDGGDASLEELVAGVDDGLYVTRFHYVNVLDRPRTLLTGMTRDGTWRIRHGELAEPVHNLRFADSVLDVLSSAERAGRDLEAFGPDYGSFGSQVAPALSASLTFSSATSH
jgi:predicted Zn-dependent protease